jgi:hypothetical protein
LDGKKLLIKTVENWPAKVLSIALAIIIFVFHRWSVLEERFFSNPLEIEESVTLAPASPYPRMIRISLRGEANSIYPILDDDIETFLDLTPYTSPGTYRIPIQIRKKGTALGVEPLEINMEPLDVMVELDQKISKYVHLSPSFQGYLETGYEMVSYTMTPSQVVVDGPQRLMDSLTELSTEFIELGGRSDDFSTSVRILNRDPLLTIRGDGMTEVRGVVRRLVIIRNFTNLPVELNGLPGQFTAETGGLIGSVRLEGTQRDLEAYEPDRAVLHLDCSQITEPGAYTLAVQADIPREFTLIRQDPAQVSIQVRFREDGAEGEGKP